MSDLISRQAAIDALCNDYCGGHQDCKYYPNCENLRSVQKLPSAQPAEPKRGRWEMGIDERSVECSECGLMTTRNELRGIAVFGKNEPNFCPNCGAKMEVTE